MNCCVARRSVFMFVCSFELLFGRFVVCCVVVVGAEADVSVDMRRGLRGRDMLRVAAVADVDKKTPFCD